jgi:hypothetical protein
LLNFQECRQMIIKSMFFFSCMQIVFSYIIWYYYYMFLIRISLTEIHRHYKIVLH